MKNIHPNFLRLLAASVLLAVSSGRAHAEAVCDSTSNPFSPTELEMDGDLPAHAVRMYKHSSAEVWTAAKAELAELGMKVEQQDEALQAFRTRAVPISKKWGVPDLHSEVDKIQLEIFVSPFVQPAHVHVRVMAIRGEARSVGLAALGNWVFDKLEARIGEKGRKVPAGWARRAQLARELLGTVEKSPCGTALPREEDITKQPRPVKAFSFAPHYPRGAFESRRQGTVCVSVVIFEDGAPIPMRAEGLGEDPAALDLRAAAVQAVNFWLFEPTRVGSCPVPIRALTPVTFKLN